MALSTVTADIFARAVTALRSARARREIAVTELTPPRRLAPYAYAVGASVREAGSRREAPPRPSPARDRNEVATGRLVLLYDPNGHPAWRGTMRLVSYVATGLEPELAGEPLLAEVGWSWLVEALDGHQAGYRALAGTVTSSTSTGFGDLGGAPPTCELEIRASWTPMDPDELAVHGEAWYALLASAAGLPPTGVLPLRGR